MPDAGTAAHPVSGPARGVAPVDRGRPWPRRLPLSRLPLTAASAGPIEAAEFARLLDPLGPFEPAPRLAVAVSGGADSLALLLLAEAWARSRGGFVLALIVDHGLRVEAAEEAAMTASRLQERGIASRVLKLSGLAAGPALAARARAARYDALEAACARLGILHLLLGHNAADQAETVAMRMLRGSGPDGLAGMAALAETAWVRLLRPVLAIPPARLRATLQARGMPWVEDPSNQDEASQRARLRRLRRDPGGDGPVTAGAVRAAAARGRARRAAEDATAAWLGRHARLDPRGFAVLDVLPPEPPPLAALLRIVAGAPYPPRPRAVSGWLARPRAATLGGVVIRPAGRLRRGGWLLCREPAAMGLPVLAHGGAVWDRRIRLLPGAVGGAEAGQLGAVLRSGSLPEVVRKGLPGLVPPVADAALCWWPRSPLAGGGFVEIGSDRPGE